MTSNRYSRACNIITERSHTFAHSTHTHAHAHKAGIQTHLHTHKHTNRRHTLRPRRNNSIYYSISAKSNINTCVCVCVHTWHDNIVNIHTSPIHAYKRAHTSFSLGVYMFVRALITRLRACVCASIVREIYGFAKLSMCIVAYAPSSVSLSSYQTHAYMWCMHVYARAAAAAAIHKQTAQCEAKCCYFGGCKQLAKTGDFKYRKHIYQHD